MSTLTQLFSNIAGAIRSKTGGTAQIQAENFPAEIAAISTGTDTSDATAAANNIEAGKTAYVNGAKVTGNLNKSSYLEFPGEATATSEKIYITGKPGSKVIVDNSSRIQISTSLSSFGNATAADVAEGKTFTGAAGLLVTGTAASPFIIAGESEKDISINPNTGIFAGTGFIPAVGYMCIEVTCHEYPSVYLRYTGFGSDAYMYTLSKKSGDTTVTHLEKRSDSIWVYNSTDERIKVHTKITVYDFAE